MLCGKNTRNTVCVLLAVVGLAFHASSASATIISPLNGSFENPVASDYDVGGGAWLGFQVPTNWLRSPNATFQITHRNVPFYAAPVDGVQLYGLECNADAPDTLTGIQQDIGTMVAGETYTFNATLYSNSGGNASAYTISFYDVTGSQTLASITEVDFNPAGLGSLATMAATFNYTATAAEAGHTLQLIMESKVGSVHYRTGIDAVTVTTTAVPEPGSIVLLMTGLFSLLAHAWRKRKCVPS